jgi:hypothetical protein
MTADDDRPWRWAFRRGCGRSPRGDELTRYQYWHGISRRDGFAAAGLWQTWPSRPIPTAGTGLSVTKSVTINPAEIEPTREPTELTEPEKTPPPASEGVEPKPRSRALPPEQKRARALLRRELKGGPRPGAQVEAAAEAAEIPERSLLAATDALGVRTQRGQWWLPG